jgi:hypothetical protein
MNDEFFNFPIASEKSQVVPAPETKEYFKLPVKTPSDQKKQPALIRIGAIPFFNRQRHSIKINGKSSYMDCSASYEEYGNKCVGCYCHENKLKEVGGSMESFLLTILDKRLIHEVSKNGSSETTFQTCRKTLNKNMPCDLCEAGITPYMVGRRHWTVGTGYFKKLRQVNLELSSKCTACDEGEILLTSLRCPSCQADIVPEKYLKSMAPTDASLLLFNTMACPRCHTKLSPTSIVQTMVCTNCNVPSRGSIFKCDIEVNAFKGDKGGASELIIKPRKFTDLTPEEKRMLIPYDFTKIFIPINLEKQAGLIKIKNPFNESSGEYKTFNEETKYKPTKEYSNFKPPLVDNVKPNQEDNMMSDEDDVDLFNG